MPTVIAGKPNAGKSTLLNALLNEERAIVSEIPGTTRDTIEDEMVLGGINFRFVDTAGLRETKDTIEALGIERTREKMKKASLILYLFDLSNSTVEEINEQFEEISALGIPFLAIGNKMDKADPQVLVNLNGQDLILISAQTNHLHLLKEKILEKVQVKDVKIGDVMVTI